MDDTTQTSPPPSDPWPTGGQPQPGGTQVLPTDVLSSHDPADGPPPRSRRTRLAVVIGLAVALVAGGLSYAGVALWYGWSHTEPESVLPATVAAFVRVDLSPGLGQQLRLNALAKKFPAGASSTEDTVRQLEHQLVDSLELDPLDYEHDIKPWFADRLAVAVWPTGTGRDQCELVALASNDDGAAKRALAKLTAAQGPSRGAELSHGYAVVSSCHGAADGQAAVTGALAAAKVQTLADLPAFADAVDTLPAGQVALAYTDLAATTRLGGLTGLADGLGLTGAVPTSLGGQVVAGLQATGDGIELRFRFSSGGGRAGGHNVRDSLGQLPGGSTIALAADLSGLPTGAGGIGAASGVGALFGSVWNLSTAGAGSAATLRLVVNAADASSAKSIMSVLGNPLNAIGAGRGVTASRDGATVTFTSKGYQPGTGKLADQELFRTALAGPDNPLLAGYVDVRKLVPGLGLTAVEQARLAPVKAIGFSAGYDGPALVGLLRVVIR